VRAAKVQPVVKIGTAQGSEPCIVSHGHMAGFRATFGEVAHGDGGITLDAAAAETLGVDAGGNVTLVAR
jgi:arginine/ornithine N-succinyltransferase beta subunit